MSLTIGEHLLEFRPRLSMARQIGEVSVRSWNPHEKKKIVSAAQADLGFVKMGGTASGPKINEAFGKMTEVLSMQPAMTQAEADQIAKATLNQRALSLIEGEGRCRGCTDVRAGKVIRIDEAGKRFSGRYYVTSAVHRYTAQAGYGTEFKVRRNAS